MRFLRSTRAVDVGRPKVDAVARTNEHTIIGNTTTLAYYYYGSTEAFTFIYISKLFLLHYLHCCYKYMIVLVPTFNVEDVGNKKYF